MPNPSKPLAPLSPESVDTLGKPRTWTVERPGNLDIEVSAWKLGEGRIDVGGPESRRTTTVEIWLTTKGRLLTVRRASSDVDGVSTVEQASQFHETPASALAWLIADGKGKLGRASKVAWVQACRTFAPMSGMEIEREGQQPE